MSQRITQSQLESYLWGAAVHLRGTIDAGDYKQFIFPLLFFKRLCDVYDEETQAALTESGGDAAFAAFPENHRFQVPDGAHWRQVRQVATNVGQALQSAMRAIETANPDKLFGIFGEAQWTNRDRLSDAMLRDLIEHFSTLDLTLANLPEDELGQGYEYLIKKFADDSGHTAAEFYTNRTVVHLMTEMLQPQPGESIYDPTCGSGGMLLSSIAHLRRQEKEWRNVRLYGQERNLMTSSIARMNCFLHGIEDFQIMRGDTLSEPKLVQGDRLMQFDLVLANPPYSIKQWDRAAFVKDPWGRNLYGTPPQGRADYAFWQHIIGSMKPETGRCAILFPHGVLFRQEEAPMRRQMIEADVIECVLGLGPNLFYNSPMEACVVICRTAKPKERQGKILFINAVNEVTRERGQSFLTGEHIERIVATYRDFKDEAGFTRVVELEEIRGKDGNLSIPMYVAAIEPTAESVSLGHEGAFDKALATWIESSIKLREVLIPAFVQGPDIAELPTVVDIGGDLPGWVNRAEWRRLQFGAFAESVNDRVEPADAPDEVYVGLEDIDSGSLHIRRWGKGSDVTGTKLRFRKGDIIFGRRRAYQRKLAVAEFDGICSAHAMVVRAKPQLVLPEYLPFLMMSNRFMNRAVEISVGSLSPTINWSTLKLEEFDLPPLEVQQRIAEVLWTLDGILVGLHAISLGLHKFEGSMHRHWHLDRLFRDEVPDWPVVKLEDLCSHVVDCLHSTPTYTSDGYPVIRTSDIRPGQIDFSEVKRVTEETYRDRIARLRPMPGDVFYSREGERYGIAAPVPDNVDLCLGQRMMHFRANDRTDPRFLIALLNSPLVYGQAVSAVIGTTSPHVNIRDIRTFKVPRPPIEEQRQIGILSAHLVDAKMSIERSLLDTSSLQLELINYLLA